MARRGWRHPSRLVVGPVIVAAGALASAWVFNRQPQLDAYAPYFFASYGLGALVHWLGLWRHRRAGLLLLAGAHFSATRYALSVAREEERKRLETGEGKLDAEGA